MDLLLNSHIYIPPVVVSETWGGGFHSQSGLRDNVACERMWMGSPALILAIFARGSAALYSLPVPVAKLGELTVSFQPCGQAGHLTELRVDDCCKTWWRQEPFEVAYEGANTGAPVTWLYRHPEASPFWGKQGGLACSNHLEQIKLLPSLKLT